MGNCIGKKSRTQIKHYCYSSVNNEENKIQIPPILIDQTDIQLIELELNSLEKDVTMGFLFSKEQKQQEINSGK